MKPGGPLLIKAHSCSMDGRVICRVKPFGAVTLPVKHSSLPHIIVPAEAARCEVWQWRSRCPERSVPWLDRGWFQGYDKESAWNYSSETGWECSYTKGCGNYPEICQILNVFRKKKLLLPHVVGVKMHFSPWKSALDFEAFEDERIIAAHLTWLPIYGIPSITGCRCSGQARSTRLVSGDTPFVSCVCLAKPLPLSSTIK